MIKPIYSSIVTIDGARVKLGLIENETQLELLIDPVRAEDGGRYTCDREEFKLKVTEHMDAPTIVDHGPSSTIKVKLNDTVSLVCQWNSTHVDQVEPIMHWWMKGSSALSLTDTPITRIVDNDRLVHLSSVLNVTVSAGNYDTIHRCSLNYRVRNPFGNNDELGSTSADVRLVSLCGENALSSRLKRQSADGIIVAVICLILVIAAIYDFYYGCKKDSNNIQDSDMPSEDIGKQNRLNQENDHLLEP